LKVNIKFIQVFYKFLVILFRDTTSEEQIPAFFAIFHYNGWKETDYKKKSSSSLLLTRFTAFYEEMRMR